MRQKALALAVAIGMAAFTVASAQSSDGVSPPEAPVALDSGQRASLTKVANDFVRTMAYGSDEQANVALRSLYPTDEEFAYARRELLGPSEAPDRKGFREILRAMRRPELLASDAYVERGEASSRIVATVVVFDPTMTSPDAILADQHCLQHRLAFLAQKFTWNGTAWEPCCHLFFTETDGPCGCCDDN